MRGLGIRAIGALFLAVALAAPAAAQTVSPLSGFAPGFNGAMAKKAADQTAVDFTGGTVLSWDAEAYDSGTIHDNVTNNTRMTVPVGATCVEVGATVTVGNGTAGADMTLAIRKNGSTSFDGTAVQTADAIGAVANTSASTGPICGLISTDYFEVAFFYTTDASIDITAARSNFWLRVIK